MILQQRSSLIAPRPEDLPAFSGVLSRFGLNHWGSPVEQGGKLLAALAAYPIHRSNRRGALALLKVALSYAAAPRKDFDAGQDEWSSRKES